MKKIYLSLFVLFLLIIIFSSFFRNNNDLTEIDIGHAGKENKKIKIAACSSCYVLAKDLDKTKYEIIPTASTAQSISLLNKGEVEMILAGRTLKPHEAVLDTFVLGEGYSLLSAYEKTVYEKDLNNYRIFTDLDAREIKNIFSVKEVYQVADVYEYLEQGIVITTWENTDYNQAEIVHLLKSDNQRVAMSRRPTLYCPQNCNQAIAKEIKNTLLKGD